MQDDPDDLVDIAGNHPKPHRRDLTGLARSPDSWQPAWIVEKYFRAPRP